MVTYRRPPALRNLLTNYKKIARDQSSKDTEGYSQPCGHCALCGNHGKHQSMVCQESYLNTPKGRFKLKQRLTCANYGIYVATCVLCGEQYVGQTKNKFSVRWTAHRSHWAKKQSGNDVGAPALRNLLTNYKKIARDQSSKDTEGYSQPCGHCALCGNHGKHQSMVCQESYLNTPKGRFKLKQRLTCANYGIYVATCVLCGEQYVGQTKNKFSVRWTAHRSHWAKKQSGNDVGALNKHYHTKHSETIHSSTSFSASYKVTFVEQPPCEDLDWCEDKWLHRINASINLGKMILPDSR